MATIKEQKEANKLAKENLKSLENIAAAQKRINELYDIGSKRTKAQNAELARQYKVLYGNQETLTDSVQHPFKHTVLNPGEFLSVQSGCPYRITAVEDSQVIEISEERFNSKSILIEDHYGRE